mgnify:CR=1 FL=1
MASTRSAELFAEAQHHIPGGVNSPVRAFRGVGGTPRFIERGAGAYLYDADGNKYVDYVLSWGPLILGHAHPDIVRAVSDPEMGRRSSAERLEAPSAPMTTSSMTSVRFGLQMLPELPPVAFERSMY